MNRFLRLPERHPGRTIALIGVLLALAYGAGLVLLPKRDGRVVIGDAAHYYVYLRSVVFDHDLKFQNDYVRLYGLRGGEPETEWMYDTSPTGHIRNMMSIGPPLLWAPLFLLVTAAVAGARAFGSTYPLDGFAWAFQASAGFSGVIAATLGAWVTYRLCARLYGARAAIWSTLAMWLGSSAIYYSCISPTYSHSASMLVVSGLFYVWATSLDRQTPGRYALVGALAGLAALVRWQDAVFLIVPFVDAAWHALATSPAHASAPAADDTIGANAWTAKWRPSLLNLTACGLAALLVFSPQVLVWMILYGQLVAMPQGGGWMQWHSPFVLLVLFSDWHGLLTWTPVVALGLAGLVLLWSRHRLIAAGAIAAFLVSLYANGAVIEWWAGEAFGARRFVSCFPILALGGAALADRYGGKLGWLVAVTAAFVVLNGLLLLQYQTFMHGLRTIAPYPRGVFGLVAARFVVPFRLIGWWWSQ